MNTNKNLRAHKRIPGRCYIINDAVFHTIIYTNNSCSGMLD